MSEISNQKLEIRSRKLEVKCRGHGVRTENS